MNETLDPKYDISTTTLSKSDQLNADDLLAGPIIVTVTDAVNVGGEQPVHIHLAGFDGKPYKPSRSMRRILEYGWGKDMRAYIGRSLRLYRNPSVRFGGQEVGGIQISGMTHIDQPIKLSLTVTRGKKAPVIVDPIDAPVSADLDQLIADATTIDELRALWDKADVNQRAIIQTRVNQLTTEQEAQ